MRKIALILMLGLLGSLANAALMPINLADHSHSAPLAQIEHDDCHNQTSAAASDRNSAVHHTVTLGHSCCIVIALENSLPWFGAMPTGQIYRTGATAQPSLEVFPAIFKPPKRYL